MIPGLEGNKNRRINVIISWELLVRSSEKSGVWSSEIELRS